MASPDPTYPLFPVVSFIGFVITLVPIPWHLQAWNSGTCFFMFWTSLACLNHCVNSVVWADNFRNSAPWWCEISIRITLGASVGIPASSLCIMRRLHFIASIQQVGTDKADKRRIILIDALICVLYPMVYIALQYVVQGHRYDIFETIGCYPALYVTMVTYFVSYAPPLATGLISAIYCCLTLYLFNRKRLQFSALVKANPNLTASRYLRLMGLASFELLCTTPICAFTVYVNSTFQLHPYISWEDTHFMYSRIEIIPYAILRTRSYGHVGMQLTRWLAPFSAFVFFSFFGFAEEARRNYVKGFRSAKALFSCSSHSSAPADTGEKHYRPPFQSNSNSSSVRPLCATSDLERASPTVTYAGPPYSPTDFQHRSLPPQSTIVARNSPTESLIDISSSPSSSTLAPINECSITFDSKHDIASS